MLVSLRKANALQTSVTELLKSLDFNTNVRINEFQNAEEEISTAVDRFEKNEVRRAKLLEVLYEIRKGVSNLNHDNGINVRLATVAKLEREVAFYTGLSKNTPRTEEKVLTGRLEKLRNQKESTDAYLGYRNTDIDTSIFTEDQLVSFKAKANDAKKYKQHVQDELLELNVKTELELSDISVSVLSTEEII